jgi:hypothetical protein
MVLSTSTIETSSLSYRRMIWRQVEQVAQDGTMDYFVERKVKGLTCQISKKMGNK